VEQTNCSLPETLRRLNERIAEQGLDRQQLLDPRDLAERTALPEATVRMLLAGGTPPSDDVKERVCARIKTVAVAYMKRTRTSKPELVLELMKHLSVSEWWARLIIDGKKAPNIEILHGLVVFFGVGEKEAFFTDDAAEALNRVLRPVVEKLENADGDPVQALLKKYGVAAADFRHHGSVTPTQLEALLAGVIRSVMPRAGDTSG
jgi:transcriptional regulator with XRE-family HTH domain